MLREKTKLKRLCCLGGGAVVRVTPGAQQQTNKQTNKQTTMRRKCWWVVTQQHSAFWPPLTIQKGNRSRCWRAWQGARQEGGGSWLASPSLLHSTPFSLAMRVALTFAWFVAGPRVKSAKQQQYTKKHFDPHAMCLGGEMGNNQRSNWEQGVTTCLALPTRGLGNTSTQPRSHQPANYWPA